MEAKCNRENIKRNNCNEITVLEGDSSLLINTITDKMNQGRKTLYSAQ